MLRAPLRKASAIPSPMMMSGTARTSVVEVSAYHEPNAPCQRAPSAARASYPARCRLSASARRPKARAAAELLARTGHHQLTDLRPGRTGPEGKNGASSHHDDSVSQPEDLVQIARVQQHGRSGAGRPKQPGMDIGRGTDVEAAGRILRHDHPGGADELPPDHQLLLIAAAQLRGSHVRPGRDHSEFPQQHGGALAREAPIDPPPPKPGIARMGAEDHVLRERELR